MTETGNQLLVRFSDALAAGLMASFGGMAAYVYQNARQDKAFKMSSFLVNIFLAFFLGNLVGNFIPNDYQYRDGLLLLSGYCSWPILGILEIKGKAFIERWMESKLGVPPMDDIKDSQDKK